MWTTRCETRWRTPATGPQACRRRHATASVRVVGGPCRLLRPACSSFSAPGAGPMHPAVLRLEAEVEEFVLKSEEPQHVFSGDMSSYEVGAVPRGCCTRQAAAFCLPACHACLQEQDTSSWSGWAALHVAALRVPVPAPQKISGIGSLARLDSVTAASHLHCPATPACCSACWRTAQRSTGAWRRPQSTTGRTRGASWPSARPARGSRRCVQQMTFCQAADD